ncbi:ATPase [Terasakiispira papahanaumokuakeensis]|uniref:ATPase n=1 Tax=Terasakiispira papahanaumokuakeensis TaxID=197479 RepID=A0A1E2V5T4_9GAMM|nr:sensor histidine kinase [Terasakiispira papahanaumokuakeensis]ODC02222.1 ATPase [Terasakiispira papahanaumokuakeensis]
MSTRPAVSAESVLRHFLGISRALAGQLEFQPMIDAVSDEIRPILPHDHLDVTLLLLDGRTHIAAYETGVNTDWGHIAQHPVPIAHSPIRSLLLGEAPYILSADATQDDRFIFPESMNHPIFEAQLRSRLHVPLRVRGEIIGALSCSTHVANFYTEADVQHTQHVADLLASYLYALRQTNEVKKLAIIEAEMRAREEGLRQGALGLTEQLERERQRIGMDLHDQTLADLTRIHRRITRLQSLPSPPQAELEQLNQILLESMRELRRLIDAVKPTVLQLFGFEEGIEDLLISTVRDSGQRIQTRLTDHTEGLGNTLDEATQIGLFRIVQEALNNAIKHANASQIEVVIHQQSSHLFLSIHDNGDGLAVNGTPHSSGLRNMYTRARLMAAHLMVQPQPYGQGTRVSVELPLPTHASGSSTHASHPHAHASNTDTARRPHEDPIN